MLIFVIIVKPNGIQIKHVMLQEQQDNRQEHHPAVLVKIHNIVMILNRVQDVKY